jgi:transposase
MPHPVAESLRPLTPEERGKLQRVKRASSELLLRHQRAVALLAVAEGMSRSEAARQAGWRSFDPMRKLVRRFNEHGLSALNDQPRHGRPATYGTDEKARILQEARRAPDREADATATWSLSLLQRALRKAPDGLPQVSTFTILHTLHEAGYSWQKSRSWCHTGRTLKKGKDGKVYQSDDPYTQEKKR